MTLVGTQYVQFVLNWHWKKMNWCLRS